MSYYDISYYSYASVLSFPTFFFISRVNMSSESFSGESTDLVGPAAPRRRVSPCCSPRCSWSTTNGPSTTTHTPHTHPLPFLLHPTMFRASRQLLAAAKPGECV